MEKNKILDLLMEATSELMDSVDTESVADDIKVLDNLNKIDVIVEGSKRDYFISDICVCEGCESLTIEIKAREED
jgi:hypothetical protein